MTSRVHWENKRMINELKAELDELEETKLCRSARVHIEKARENLSYAGQAEEFTARGVNSDD